MCNYFSIYIARLHKFRAILYFSKCFIQHYNYVLSSLKSSCYWHSNFNIVYTYSAYLLHKICYPGGVSCSTLENQNYEEVDLYVYYLL